jgi:hypothetical protein
LLDDPWEPSHDRLQLATETQRNITKVDLRLRRRPIDDEIPPEHEYRDGNMRGRDTATDSSQCVTWSDPPNEERESHDGDVEDQTERAHSNKQDSADKKENPFNAGG